MSETDKNYQVTLSMPIDEVDTPEEAIKQFKAFVLGSGWHFYSYTVHDDNTGETFVVEGQDVPGLDEE